MTTYNKCPSCGRKGTSDGVPIYECGKCHHLFCVQCAVKMGKRTDRCPICEHEEIGFAGQALDR